MLRILNDIQLFRFRRHLVGALAEALGVGAVTRDEKDRARRDLPDIVQREGEASVCLQLGKERRCRAGKRTVAHPNHIHMRFYLRLEGTEAQLALTGQVQYLIEADCVADAVRDHQRSIENQAVGPDNIDLLRLKPQQLAHDGLMIRPSRRDERLAGQICCLDRLLFRERTILSHQDAPCVGVGDRDGLI